MQGEKHKAAAKNHKQTPRNVFDPLLWLDLHRKQKAMLLLALTWDWHLVWHKLWSRFVDLNMLVEHKSYRLKNFISTELLLWMEIQLRRTRKCYFLLYVSMAIQVLNFIHGVLEKVLNLNWWSALPSHIIFAAVTVTSLLIKVICRYVVFCILAKVFNLIWSDHVLW